MALWRKSLTLLADVIFPRVCPLCRAVLDDHDSPWCRGCTGDILAATGQAYCLRCGTTAEPHLVDAGGCRLCRNQPLPFTGLARVGAYEGPVGEMIRLYKYGRQQWLDATLADLLAAAIAGQPWAGELDALVPVPASWRERFGYHFYPVGLLADEAGKRLAIPALPLLRVKGKTKRQVELTPSQRLVNVRGKFHPAPGARIEGARICLIDDVSTSTATLQANARALKRAGAASVHAAVLARASRTHHNAPSAHGTSLTE